MKKVTDYESLVNSVLSKQEKHIVKHYLQELFELYGIDTIKDIGSIYIIEDNNELNNFKAFEMYEPISADNIEFADKVFLPTISTQEPLFVLGCFVTSTDYAVYLLLPKSIISAENLNIFYQAKYITNKYIDLED